MEASARGPSEARHGTRDPAPRRPGSRTDATVRTPFRFQPIEGAPSTSIRTRSASTGAAAPACPPADGPPRRRGPAPPERPTPRSPTPGPSVRALPRPPRRLCHASSSLGSEDTPNSRTRTGWRGGPERGSPHVLGASRPSPAAEEPAAKPQAAPDAPLGQTAPPPAGPDSCCCCKGSGAITRPGWGVGRSRPAPGTRLPSPRATSPAAHALTRGLVHACVPSFRQFCIKSSAPRLKCRPLRRVRPKCPEARSPDPEISPGSWARSHMRLGGQLRPASSHHRSQLPLRPGHQWFIFPGLSRRAQPRAQGSRGLPWETKATSPLSPQPPGPHAQRTPARHLCPRIRIRTF